LQIRSSLQKLPQAIKTIKYKILHCTDNINALPLQRIGNNVEAFRYYLAFEIWTISTQQDNG